MTLNIRQSYPSMEFEKVVDSGFFSDAHNAVYRDVLKRGIDILIVLMVALPVFTVLLVLCALIALDGKSPIYFQDRIGKNGRHFKMWKLRSMVVDADKMLEAYLAKNPVAKLEWDSTQKLKKDPRITKIGRIIRKTSLDELPQLVNVLLGHMSIVGPRPMMPEQRTMYPGLAYYALRPGITGYWQISVRNESNFAERANFDTSYFRELSLRTDLSVMAKTFGVVLRGTGY